jgi:hypothetical protein
VGGYRSNHKCFKPHCHNLCDEPIKGLFNALPTPIALIVYMEAKFESVSIKGRKMFIN